MQPDAMPYFNSRVLRKNIGLGATSGELRVHGAGLRLRVASMYWFDIVINTVLYYI